MTSAPHPPGNNAQQPGRHPADRPAAPTLPPTLPRTPRLHPRVYPLPQNPKGNLPCPGSTPLPQLRSERGVDPGQGRTSRKREGVQRRRTSKRSRRKCSGRGEEKAGRRDGEKEAE